MEETRVLVVRDPAKENSERLQAPIAKGYVVDVANGIDDALERYGECRYAVAVIDTHKGGPERSLEIARNLRERHPETKVIITGESRRKAAATDFQVNVFAYVKRSEAADGDLLSDAIGRAFNAQREEKVRKQMLSMLTHTMRNTLVATVPAIDEIVEKFGPARHHLVDDKEGYIIASNVAYLRTVMKTIDAMFDAYKLLVRTPENTRDSWLADNDGDATLVEVVDRAIAAVLGRLLFQEAQKSAFGRFQRALGAGSRKQIKRAFMRDYLLVDPDQRGPIVDWLRAHFSIIQIAGDLPAMRFSSEGMRFSLLFAVISELVFNAVKYADGKTPVRIKWQCRDDSFGVLVENAFDKESTRRTGSGEGRNFIALLLSQLDGIDVVYPGIEGGRQTFRAELIIQKSIN
ncbi:MAG: hypothetical protein AAF772_04890 [Acidobacteriota bacterium]